MRLRIGDPSSHVPFFPAGAPGGPNGAFRMEILRGPEGRRRRAANVVLVRPVIPDLGEPLLSPRRIRRILAGVLWTLVLSGAVFALALPAGFGPTCRDSCPPERTREAVATQRAACEGLFYDWWAPNAEAHPADLRWWATYGHGPMKAKAVGPEAKAEFVGRCLNDHFDG